MRSVLLFTLLLSSVSLAYGQFGPQRVVTDSTFGASSVIAADLDGDGDMDLASASDFDSKIAWYENLGDGTFSGQKVVTNLADRPNTVYAADLDSDGDIDLVSASDRDDEIAWYENLGGGTFSSQKIISNTADRANTAIAADFDGDGDIDLASASFEDDKIAWYENLGMGTFSTEKVISTAANGALWVAAADFDGDGDMDIASASNIDDKIAWYENTGGGSFSAQKVISTAANSARNVIAFDLDGDGDIDLASASSNDNKIAWYENNGNGSFSTQNVISTQALGPFSLFAADIDSDGDLDVASASLYDDKIAWYENQGSGNFSSQKVISTRTDGACSVCAADFDGDGDIDIASASRFDNRIAWHENYFIGGATIKGKVWSDNNKNCDTTGDSGYAHTLIKTSPQANFAKTDSMGNYELWVDTGITYQVSLVKPKLAVFPFSVCRDTIYTLRFDSAGADTTGFDWLVQAPQCHYLSTSLSSNRRRRCFESSTFVRYENKGNLPADSVKVYVEFPDFVRLVSANQAFTKISDSLYSFNIGSLAPGASGQIRILDSVICGIDTIRGISQCTKAWITPAPNCVQPDPRWDGAELELSHTCGASGLSNVLVKNTTVSTMSDSASLRVWLGQQMVFTTKFLLQGNDSLPLQIPRGNRTLRVEVDQTAYHPTKTVTSLVVENCDSTFIAQGMQQGIAAAYPPSDEAPNEDIDCMIIIDSYDPNDKQVSPRGIFSENFVKPGTKLTYKVRFQNTGTDTAYTVRIVDTLDSDLDLATLELGAHSHNYEFGLAGKGAPVLTFTHRNIMLPDSTTDEENSIGFITYSIKPYDTVPDFTVVNNEADIYFDFNLPIRTNQTKTTLYDTVIVNFNDAAHQQIVLMDIQDGRQVEQVIKAYPNPTTGVLNLELPENSQGQYRLMNTKGQVLQAGELAGQQSQIDLSKSPKGLYFLELRTSEQVKVLKVLRD